MQRVDRTALAAPPVADAFEALFKTSQQIVQLRAAAKAIGGKIELLSGERESQLAALGVISGFHKPDGFVGDLGGGSLELADVQGSRIGKRVSLPLGGLALMDVSDRSPKKAQKIVREALSDLKRTRSMAYVQDRLLPLDEYYKVVRLDEQLAREKAYDDEARQIAQRLIDGT